MPIKVTGLTSSRDNHTAFAVLIGAFHVLLMITFSALSLAALPNTA
jgi:hypothetical protein